MAASLPRRERDKLRHYATLAQAVARGRRLWNEHAPMPADGWDAWGGSDGPVRIVIIMANKTLGTRQKLVFRDGQQKHVSPPRKQAPVPGPPASPWRTGTPHNAGAGPRQGANRRLCPWLPAASKDDVPQD